MRAREHAGLEQADVAEYAGISRASVSAYENGKTVPKLAVLRVWAERCDVPLDWLVTGREQGSPSSAWVTEAEQLALFDLHPPEATLFELHLVPGDRLGLAA